MVDPKSENFGETYPRPIPFLSEGDMVPEVTLPINCPSESKISYPVVVPLCPLLQKLLIFDSEYSVWLPISYLS